MFLKDAFQVSLCKNGLLGGLLYLKEAGLLYCTNKLTVPERLRRLHLPFADIRSIEKAPLHTVLVSMKNGETYRFLVFSREKFLRRLPPR